MAFQFQGTAPLLCTVNRIHEEKVAEAWRKDYYLYAKSGVAATGFVKDSKGNIRYFSKTGIMATGWLTSSSGVKRYFDTTSKTATNGIMAVGFKTIN
mgnify:CR=1 FL=1